MKRFKFRLEKVLEFRRGEQLEKKRVLGLAIRELNEMNEGLGKLEESFSMNVVPSDGVHSVDLFLLKGRYDEKLRESIAKQKSDISDSEKKVDEARQEYINATKEVKILEKLKDKKEEQYIESVHQQEQLVLDELIIQRKVDK